MVKKQQSFSDKLSSVMFKYAKTWLLLVIVGAVSLLGYGMVRGSFAATGASIYLAPASSTVVPGSTFSVAVHENSGTSEINAAQVSLTYNPSQLEYVSMTEGTAFPNVAATSNSTPGVIRVARGTTGGTSVTGDNVLITVTFKAVAKNATATVGIDPNYSMVVSSTDSTNLLSSTTGGTYTIKRGGKH